MLSAQKAESNDLVNHTEEQKFYFDTVIVFGQGPIKPILLVEELTYKQQQALALYNQDSLNNPEPDFWLMQQPRYLSQLLKIEQDKTLSRSEKKSLKEQTVQKWQHIGWFALKRMGRQNGLAAGYALYKGLTKEVIVSGGRTISPSARNYLPKERLNNWPSEAELMAEIIKTYYGDLYQKKFGKHISEVIKIENASTNTLENFVYTINAYPQLLSHTVKIGFISAGHHMRRIRLLAKIFDIPLPEKYELPAQELLKHADEIANEEIIDVSNCADVKLQSTREERWIRGLNDPQYITYWLGYIAEVKQQCVLQKTLDRLQDTVWEKAAASACKKVGISLEEFSGENIAQLAKNKPEKYASFVRALQQLKKPEYRTLPPHLL
ncbi:MAG TPA: YdcF family protein [Methylomirabilota bacterium]|nr:YdcF family protein [Methylomirabilota bacterium]